MTRLPLRINPRPGESWLGYLGRAADAFRLDTTTRALAPLLDEGERSRSRPKTRRGYGIAALPATYERLADYFNLEPRQVKAMFVESYTTVTGHWTDEDRRRFDLFDTGGEPRIWAPGIRSSRHLVRCSACQAEQPDWWALSWWLTSHVLCERHALTLTPPRVSGYLVARELSLVQQQVLRIAAGDGESIPWTEPDAFMADLTIMASSWGTQAISVETLVPAARYLFTRPGTQALPAIYAQPTFRRVYGSRTSHDLGYPWGDADRSRLILDLLNLPEPPPYAALVRYRTPPIGPLSGVPNEPRFYPVLLPTDLYLEHFAMLCDQLPINRGRWLTAAAVWQVTVGPPWGHGPSRTQSFRPLAQLQAALERVGRLERFWSTVSQVALTMAAHPIDYQHRRNQLTEDAIHAITRAAPRNTHSGIRLWLQLHWACYRPCGYRKEADRLPFHQENKAALSHIAAQTLGPTEPLDTPAEGGRP